MIKVLISIIIILLLFSAWVFVQHLARRFASRHPELGPAREEGGGCGISCGCSGKERRNCIKEKKLSTDT